MQVRNQRYIVDVLCYVRITSNHSHTKIQHDDDLSSWFIIIHHHHRCYNDNSIYTQKTYIKRLTVPWKRWGYWSTGRCAEATGCFHTNLCQRLGSPHYLVPLRVSIRTGDGTHTARTAWWQISDRLWHCESYNMSRCEWLIEIITQINSDNKSDSQTSGTQRVHTVYSI